MDDLKMKEIMTKREELALLMDNLIDEALLNSIFKTLHELDEIVGLNPETEEEVNLTDKLGIMKDTVEALARNDVNYFLGDLLK